MITSRHYAAFAAAFLISTVAAVSQAAIIPGTGPLSLTKSNPDVNSIFTTITYDSSSRELTATGLAKTLTLPPSTSSNIAAGSFSLDVFLNVTTVGGITSVSANHGSLTITGNPGTALPGSGVRTLFSSTLFSNFGFNTNGTDDFQFIFNNNTGIISNGSALGLELHGQNSVFTTAQTGSLFLSNFNDGGAGISLSDTFAVPEPASLSLLALAAPALLRRRRKA